MQDCHDLSVERHIKRFERAWQQGAHPPLDEYLPDEGDAQAAVLLELVHTDLEYRLKAGEAARVEEYVQRYPALGADQAALHDLLRAEWELRRRREPELRWEDCQSRFPQSGTEHPAATNGTPIPLQLNCPQCGQPLSLSETGSNKQRACSTCGLVFYLEGERPCPAALAPGARLGKYELREIIGRGAFGVVYRAHDTELNRSVAVKVPRLGSLACPEDADRFLREARSAAALRHPRIITVFDAGQIGDTCYLVSAFVQGQTLAKRLAAGKLPFREAVELLLPVAEAIHYAHTQGVIHRDLKPSNILIDEAGRPNVMDFGLARRDSAEVRLTREGEMLGTPAYMSPEQARGEAHTADGRTDVYSLGVILYELLTGELPFRGQVRMLLRQVLEDEPRPPRRLNDLVPRDLETICLKALAKEPARRYATAQDLADDLRRWRNGESIRARPTLWYEQAWRWAKRRPAAAGLIVLSLTALAVLLLGGTLVHRRLQAQHQRAEQSVERALRAVDQMLTRVGDQQLADVPGLEEVRRTLLEDARTLLQELHQAESAHPVVQLAMGQVYRRIGFLYHQLDVHPNAEQSCAQSVTLFQRLAEADPRAPNTRQELAHSYRILALVQRKTSQFEQARLALESALTLLQKLVALAPANLDYAFDLGKVHLVRGWVLRELRRDPEAEGEYRQSAVLMQQLVDRRPEDAAYRLELARVLHFWGWLKSDQARKAGGDQAQELSEQAEEHYRRATALRGELVRQFPTISRHREDLGDSYTNLANLLRERNQPEESEQLHEWCIGLWQEQVDAFPLRVWYRNRLGNALNNLVVLHLDRKQHLERCHELLASAIVHQRAALARNPRNPDTLRFLANHHANRTRLAVLEEDHEAAVQAAAELVRVREVGEDYHRAANYLTCCIPLTEKDVKLSEDERKSLAHTYAERAMELLREAARQGHRNQEDLRKNKAFAPLRHRKDFADLLN